MKNFLDFCNLFLIKTILFIQFLNQRILKRKFSKDRLELLKHKLNFYIYNLEKRNNLRVNFEYKFGKDIKVNIFKVDINKFTGFDGFYTFNGSAPLLKTAIEIYKKPNLNFKKSYLYKFYNDFQPKNYGELYKLSLNNSLYDLSSFLQFKPWINNVIDKSNLRKGLFGPSEINEVEHRLLRLKNIFRNIEKFGYIPSEKDIIKGYILKSNNDYRFLITSGHHRVAAMKAINSVHPDKFKKVIVAFEERRCNLKFVNQEDINKWPAVINKFCSKEDAFELFQKFFYN